MSFSAHIAKETALVYDIRVTLEGEPHYFIVQVTPATRTAFLAAIEADAGFTIEDYGTILHRGWEEPSNALKQELHEKFGMPLN